LLSLRTLLLIALVSFLVMCDGLGDLFLRQLAVVFIVQDVFRDLLVFISCSISYLLLVVGRFVSILPSASRRSPAAPLAGGSVQKKFSIGEPGGVARA
jgi:hypothetical protein